MSERSGSSSVPTVRVTEPNPVPTRLGVFPSGDGLDVAVVARAASGGGLGTFPRGGALGLYGVGRISASPTG